MISQILHYKYLLFSFVILRLYLNDELNSRAGGGGLQLGSVVKIDAFATQFIETMHRSNLKVDHFKAFQSNSSGSVFIVFL